MRRAQVENPSFIGKASRILAGVRSIQHMSHHILCRLGYRRRWGVAIGQGQKARNGATIEWNGGSGSDSRQISHDVGGNFSGKTHADDQDGSGPHRRGQAGQYQCFAKVPLEYAASAQMRQGAQQGAIQFACDLGGILSGRNERHAHDQQIDVGRYRVDPASLKMHAMIGAYRLRLYTIHSVFPAVGGADVDGPPLYGITLQAGHPAVAFKPDGFWTIMLHSPVVISGENSAVLRDCVQRIFVMGAG